MSRRILTGWLIVLVIGMAATNGTAQDGNGGDPAPLELFNQRILPIFKSPKPSSCVQCHLAAVDLKNYIHPSQEKTFASLRDQGLIDFKQPENSKILTLIKMGEKDLDKGARLIHEKTRKAEYQAFAAWIRACCNDPELLALPRLDAAAQIGPEMPDEVIRHTRKSRVVDSFVRNIWSQRMRCFPCHTPHEIDPANPRHKAAMKTQRQFKETYSEEITSRLPIFHETPEETLKYLIEKSRATPKGELPIINLQDPRRSLLVMKPTSKLPPKKADGTFEIPPADGAMYHLGGLKMHKDDQSYKSFIAWIQDYANVVGNRYASVEDLPADNWSGSDLVLKLMSAPEAWPVGTPVQLFVHAWDEKQSSWGAEPVAFTQGTVTPRRMVNGSLFLLRQRQQNSHYEKSPDRENATLERGKYLVKVYLDARHRLEKDPALLLGQEDFQGQAEIESARWREGFRHGEKVFGNELTSK